MFHCFFGYKPISLAEKHSPLWPEKELKRVHRRSERERKNCRCSNLSSLSQRQRQQPDREPEVEARNFDFTTFFFIRSSLELFLLPVAITASTAGRCYYSSGDLQWRRRRSRVHRKAAAVAHRQAGKPRESSSSPQQPPLGTGPLQRVQFSCAPACLPATSHTI